MPWVFFISGDARTKEIGDVVHFHSILWMNRLKKCNVCREGICETNNVSSSRGSQSTIFEDFRRVSIENLSRN
jgi:hypothetical protein